MAASEEIVSPVFPLFVSVMICAALEVPTSCEAKVRDEGENAATAARPVPLKLTGAGGVLLLLDSDSDPVRLPMTAGLKTTLMVQLVPAPSDVPQLLVWL